jgi:hypothetical protein
VPACFRAVVCSARVVVYSDPEACILVPQEDDVPGSAENRKSMSSTKKASAAITVARSRAGSKSKKQNRWVAKVKTDSTHPPKGLFTRKAASIARALASKKVSPKGPGSGMRMLTYFINRAGKGLTAAHKAELEKAKSLLAKRVEEERQRRRSAATSRG